MTEQPYAPPEPSPRPMPRLGGGLVWSDIVAKIEADRQKQREPAENPLVRVRHQLGIEAVAANSQPGRNLEQPGVEPPVTLLPGESRFLLGRDALTSACDEIGDNQHPIRQARSWAITPPPAAELLAMADDLNAHGGVDETFVAALLREAADPSHLIGDRNPVTTPRAVDNPLDDDPVASARRQLGIAQWVPATEVPGPKRSTTEILEAFRETVTALTPVLDAAGFGDPSQAPDCSAGRHIWSMTSPVRCVECRRYLRPWWRRALDRVRRWR